MLKWEFVMKKDQQIIPNLQQKKRQLLVADDDKAIQKILSRTLSYMGHDVTLAGNGLEASTLFLTASYDLVVTDFQMPLMNGLELSRLVKEQSPNTPVIVITAFCGETSREELTKCADALIPKPFKLQEIQKTVQSLLNSAA